MSLLDIELYTVTFEALFRWDDYIVAVVFCHFVDFLFDSVSFKFAFDECVLNSFVVMAPAEFLFDLL